MQTRESKHLHFLWMIWQWRVFGYGYYIRWQRISDDLQLKTHEGGFGLLMGIEIGNENEGYWNGGKWEQEWFEIPMDTEGMS